MEYEIIRERASKIFKVQTIEISIFSSQVYIELLFPYGQEKNIIPIINSKTIKTQTISALNPASNNLLQRGSRSLYSPVLTVHLPL